MSRCRRLTTTTVCTNICSTGIISNYMNTNLYIFCTTNIQGILHIHHILLGERCDPRLLQGLHLCALFLKSLRQPCLRRARRRPYVTIAYVSHSAVSVVSVVSVSLWHSHWTLPQYFEKAWLSILYTRCYTILQSATTCNLQC